MRSTKRWLVGLVVAAVLGGCGEESALTLLVDLRTDLRPAVEFAAVEVEVSGASGSQRAASPALAAHDFVAGRRVAEIDGLAPGDETVRVALVDSAGTTVVARRVDITLSSDTGITVVIARDCLGVACPGETECRGGACVDARCHAGALSSCGTLECGSDGDCVAPDDCMHGSCAAGVCLFAADPACAADAGMLDAATVDAGSDAGTDAGPSRTCMEDSDCASGEVCNAMSVCAGTCPAHPVEPFATVPCDPGTLACVDGCSDDMCYESCVGGLSSDCHACLTQNVVACYNAHGCAAVWSCFEECANTSCGGVPNETCVSATCGPEYAAWMDCSVASGATCTAERMACEGP